MSYQNVATLLDLTPEMIQQLNDPGKVSQLIGLSIVLTPKQLEQCRYPLTLLRERRKYLKWRRQHGLQLKLAGKKQLSRGNKLSSTHNADVNTLCQKKGQINGINLLFNQCISSAFQRVGSLLLKPFSKNAQEQKTSKPLVQQEEETLLLAREPEESIASDPIISLKQKKIK